jgi:choline kinase
VYGTFENGRIEEYFDSSTLTAADIRKPSVSQWIGMRMAELHCVDIDAVEGAPHPLEEEGQTWDVAAKRNVAEWLGHARGVLALPSFPEDVRREIDIDGFEETWKRYVAWLDNFESKHGKSPRVFAHNDTQYGNLLRMNKPKPGTPEHRQIVVVDFEYASPNSAAFDIANHFHEWTANYHGPTPHLLDPSIYPTARERDNFYRAYLAAHAPNTSPRADALKAMDALTSAWSPASHGMWAVWGLVQARDDLEQPGDGEPEFDYIGYARCRIELFRKGVEELIG